MVPQGACVAALRHGMPEVDAPCDCAFCPVHVSVILSQLNEEMTSLLYGPQWGNPHPFQNDATDDVP